MPSKENNSEQTAIIQLQQQLDNCCLREQSDYKNHLQAIKKRQRNNQPIDKSLDILSKKIATSIEKVKTLDTQCPQISYPDELPITQRVEDISVAIEKYQVVIIAGETGSGKTTQIPKICLALGRGRKGLIGHTQPRRLAARTVSARIAEELKVKLGDQVGYKIRFDDVSSSKANILVMTDGMLLAEMSSDPLLLAYDTLIIDEAHERSLNIDFLLGYLHQLLKKRSDLKLIITSATIDPVRFSKHFYDAPIIEVSGRTYPVEVRYRPLLIENELNADEQQKNEIHREPLDAMAEAVDELIQHGSGDILIFLPGEREIRDAAGYLRKQFFTKLDIFPLYSRLSKNEQNKIFKAHSKTRVVLATNVAETSLTVPGIRYVIDTGVARISRYNQRSKIQQLPIESISRASADQRKGRCGRLEDGICIRLYSEDDFNNRKEFTEPEIHRTNLASVILKMLDMGLGEIEQFPFVEPPENKRISDGFRLLQSLQAIDSRQKITSSGKKLAKFPVDPRFGKMLLTAAKYGSLKELLIIVSALSVQDIRERPLEKRQQADEFHKRFNTTNSDFICLLNIWKYSHHIRQQLSSSQFRKRLSKEFLSFLRLRDWMETYRQLSSLCKQSNLEMSQLPADYAAIHKAIISGMPDQLGTKSPEGDYMAARNSRFIVNRQSAVCVKTSPENFQQLLPDNKLVEWLAPSAKWVVAAELVETQKVYARHVAAIETQWVVEIAADLIKRRVFDPYWSKKSGCCKAYLQQSIFGLILESKKPINYETEDKQFCREIFLKEGLVERKLNTRIIEIQQFWNACDEIAQQEDKTRRRDRLVNMESLIKLLDAKIPEGIVSLGQLNRWYKKSNLQQRKQLLISAQDLLRDDVEKMPKLPQFWNLGEIQLPISYRFEPGANDDGMTVQIPLALLASLDNSDFEYLIPSLLREKIIALLKGLPKKLRKNFVPVPDFTDAVLQRMNDLNNQHKPEKLLTVICKHLKQMTGISINIEDFDNVAIPEQLQVNFNIIDDQGNTLVMGRDLLFLQQHAESKNWDVNPIDTLQDTALDYPDELDYWPEDEFNHSIEITRSGIKILQYPGLFQDKQKVKVKLFSSKAEAEFETQRATVQLLRINLSAQCGFLKNEIANRQQLSLAYSSMGSYADFVDDVCWNSIQCLISEQNIDNKQKFTQILEKIRGELVTVAVSHSALILTILEQKVSISKQLKGALSVEAIASYQNIGSILEQLIYPGFIREVSLSRLKSYSRYLNSLLLRLEKLPHNGTRERAEIEVLNTWNHKINKLNAKIPLWSEEYPALQQLYITLDELSVSFFTQELGTAMPVSEKRLGKQYNNLLDSLG